MPLSNLLDNKEPLNKCNIHLNNKLINFLKNYKKGICLKCKEDLHKNLDFEKEIIDKPKCKEDANILLGIIKEKEKQFNNEINLFININKNEEKIEKGIEDKIEILNEEKTNYRKQIKDYKENNIKTFCFLRNLYERYLNNFDNENNNEDPNKNENNNDIMLTNHILNFSIKTNDISKFKTNVDEIIKNYNNVQKELQLKYNDGFQKGDLKIKNIGNSKDKGFTCIKSLKGHTNKIVSLTELYSGKLISGSYDSTLRIWDLNSEKEDKNTNTKCKVFCLSEFEKNQILIGTDDYSILLWNLELSNEECIYNFAGHEL